MSLAEATEGVRERLAAAVKKRLIADVPLGVLLSGGVDSAAVLTFATRAAGAPMRTFTLGFEGPSFYDERAAAARMARHAGALHHEDVVRPAAASLMETLLHHHDEPFGDSSALPTYLVAREARQHVTVVLNGDGGDETFAGYERFRAEQIAHRVPRPLRALLRTRRACAAAGAHVLRHAAAAAPLRREVRAAVPGAHARLAQLLRAADAPRPRPRRADRPPGACSRRTATCCRAPPGRRTCRACCT